MKLFISHSQADRAFAERLTTRIQALGAKVWSDEKVEPGENWDKTLREALESSDGIVLVVPEPGTAKANSAFFEAGAARALGKPVVAVIPEAESSRVGELPADVYGLAVFDGSHVGPEVLAEKIVSALKAA
jgi:nucleoside 2-deoxyribosyltransferase